MLKYVQHPMVLLVTAILVTFDVLFLNIVFAFTGFLTTQYDLVNPDHLLSGNHFSLWMIYNLSVAVAAIQFRIYSRQTMEHLENVFRATLRCVLVHQIIFLVCAFIGYRFMDMWWFWAIQFLLTSIYIAISRFLLTYVYTVLPKRYSKLSKRVALIGDQEFITPVADVLAKENPLFNINTTQYGGMALDMTEDEKVDMFKKYFEEVSKEGIHDVFIATSPDMYAYSKDLIMAADHQCVKLSFVPVMTANIVYNDAQMSPISVDLPVFKSHEEPMSTLENRAKKRIIDFLISSFVIVFILSWLIPIIGIIIKIQSPGPIFFKQLRSGRNNQPFYCYKFRSMVVNNDANKNQATKGDKRITPIGEFLRKSNLDEFPQFLNVFMGQMSVVGPRPHMLSHTEHYSNLIRHYMVRHFVKPGITGWAQVNGFRGETKDPSLMAKRVEYDIDYMTNWNAMLDFKIVCMTAINMIRGEKNAY